VTQRTDNMHRRAWPGRFRTDSKCTSLADFTEAGIVGTGRYSSGMADQVGGPDDCREPNVLRRNVGYAVTGWRIVRLRRRARRESRLHWYGQWRNYLQPGLVALLVGLVVSLLVGVTAGSVGLVIVYVLGLEFAYKTDTRPDDPPREADLRP